MNPQTLRTSSGERPVTAFSRALERERELDRYRVEVERLLGSRASLASEDHLARLFEHMERCFDWGVSTAACARTWLARDAARNPEGGA